MRMWPRSLLRPAAAVLLAIPAGAEEHGQRVLRLEGACSTLDYLNHDVFVRQPNPTASGAPYWKAEGVDHYIYYDPSCSGRDGGSPRWILDDDAPSLTRASDLDGDGGCTYHARVISGDASRPPASATWRMYCDGQWTDRAVTLQDAGTAEASASTSVGAQTLDAAAAPAAPRSQPSSAAGASFSKLDAGARCHDYRIDEVLSKEACFNAAAVATGISPARKVQIDGVGYSGCALNTVANALIYSVTPTATPATHVALPTLQYLCSGSPTTTTTVTTTATTVTATTVTATTVTATTTSGLFARLGPGSRCSDQGVPDVPSKEACFGAAREWVGLGSTATMELNNIGFSGCLFNSVAKMVMYGVTHGVTSESNMKLHTFEYVCNGIPGATSTTTATLTTTTLVFARMAAGQRCSDHHMAAVASKEACFGAAASSVGLAGKTSFESNFMGFTGCVYNALAGILMYGTTPGVTPATTMALPNFEYVCSGSPILFP